MITEILAKTIYEVQLTGKFEITEFQLGKELYQILKEEVESKILDIKVNVNSVNEFMGVPIKMHYSDDAVIYAIKIRKLS